MGYRWLRLSIDSGGLCGAIDGGKTIERCVSLLVGLVGQPQAMGAEELSERDLPTELERSAIAYLSFLDLEDVPLGFEARIECTAYSS